MNWREDVYPSQLVSRLSVSPEQYQSDYCCVYCPCDSVGSGEMARTSYSLNENIVSEILYFISLVLLFYNFITLTYESLHGFGIIPIVAAGLFYVIWRTFANFRLLRRT